ncbi:ephrin-B2-like [Clavelina lepadiformis]|uniref:Ephrin RBD domain-containing protein n=1 Tax=Clavelina lepadiformis TaxID=159417 RepID=A0ABP0G2U1_CLALP
MIRIIFLVLVITVDVSSPTKRHVIYWNSQMTPQLLSKEEWVLPVKIGEFMDILCPQKSLMGITHGPGEPEVFDLYNVTETDFDNCSHGGKNNFIFSCNLPEQENKLTIKFQLISPSPLGFRFQYCEDYYFVAVPRVKDLKPGCQETISTRLHISVACKHGRPNRPKITTTTKTTTTTSTSSTKMNTRPTTTVKSVSRKEEDLVIPKVVPPSRHPEPDKVQQQSQTDKKNGDGNASIRYHAKWPVIIMSSLISLFLVSFLTTSDLCVTVT